MFNRDTACPRLYILICYAGSIINVSKLLLLSFPCETFPSYVFVFRSSFRVLPSLVSLDPLPPLTFISSTLFRQRLRLPGQPYHTILDRVQQSGTVPHSGFTSRDGTLILFPTRTTSHRSRRTRYSRQLVTV